MNLFEEASRQKLRFETARGNLSVEDLWDLPLTSQAGRPNLDAIAISLHQQLRTTSEVVSFVDEAATADPTIQLRFDVIKHIIEKRKTENAEQLKAKEKKELKQQLLAALARKREGVIESMSEEDLQKKLAEL